ncbi:MAG TPA: TIGR00730 family Rossman fold protein [Gammaproteobacteria bacterium]|nr:TIGR00730 family Rossman fold protein [Gammaproteobacteria bacterium]
MSKPSPKAPRIAPPPHPRRRQEPLPDQEPKSGEDDADAPRRVRTLLESPSYREAEADVDFLSGYETRGVRLQIDYAKAETLLAEYGVAHTIVVFGSTRINEPSAARRAVETLKSKVAAAPNDERLRGRLARAERVLAKSRYYDVARELGRLVSTAGAKAVSGVAGGKPGAGVVVLTGGGPGIMEAANRGAFDAGAKTVGLNITLPHEQFPNPYITPELCFRFHYFAIRKLHFLLRARALVAFPGGYGTFDELFETLTLVQTRRMEPVPIVLVGEDYWRRAFDVDFLVDEGTIDPEDRDLFWYAESAEEIWHGILHWHEVNGRPLI